MIKRCLRRILSGPAGATIAAAAWSRSASRVGLKLRLHGKAIDMERDGKILRIRASHTLYVPHMIENFDYYFNSVVPASCGGKLLVDMSGPRFHTLIGFDSIPFLFPSHTEPYSTTAEYLDFADLRPGMTVFDIGAYSGVTSIIFSRLISPTGRVYAFEADDTNYQCAKANIIWAKAENVSLINKAVWSHNDGLIFSNEHSMGSSAVEITGGGRGDERRVETTTIEHFCEENGINRIDFVKLDIEGAETEVLRRSARTFKQLGARLIVEPHRIAGKLNTDECLRLARDAGFNACVRQKTPGSEALIECI